MPHSPQYKSAGLSILRYVYETCELLGVQNGEIVPLLEDLRDAVLIGQHGNAVKPDVKPTGRILPDVVDRIFQEHAKGNSPLSTALTLAIDVRTVKRYLSASNGTIPVAETPPSMLPNSHGATDRRADDQEPPKV